jgi:hypothetical protein
MSPRPCLAIATLFCAFALLLASPALFAQGKAYAPDNLRSLSVPDQVRVIEREYADQSGGRLIPDDQLEFYLDQVHSGWRFSDVKNDIAQSLRGSSWRPPSSGWNQRNVTCSSLDKRYTECRTPFRGPVTLTFQFSAAECIEGRTWGQNRGVIWVDRGCRAQFSEDRRSPGFGQPGGIVGAGIICESREGKRRRCQTGFRGPVVLVEQYSDAPCIEGSTWGSAPGEVWVSRGCRARFEETRGLPPSRPGYGQGPGYGAGYGGYSVTCASEGGRYRTCAWDQRQGYPTLIEQISRDACVEGRTWGYQRGELWVDQGCRARFGSR